MIFARRAPSPVRSKEKALVNCLSVKPKLFQARDEVIVPPLLLVLLLPILFTLCGFDVGPIELQRIHADDLQLGAAIRARDSLALGRVSA
jgi:hypothetical protein